MRLNGEDMYIDEDEIRNLLQTLVDVTTQTIDTERASGSLQPEEVEFFRWKVDQFTYDDKGLTNHSATSEKVTRPSWRRSQTKLIEIIEKTSEYKGVLDNLISILEVKQQTYDHYLVHFINKLVYTYLNETDFDEAQANELITIFIKDLKKEPLKCGAEVELQGIILQPDEIEISHGVTLRKPRIEDLEKEIPTYGFTPHLSDPSAYLKIEFLGRSPREIQVKVDKALATLRLFKPGSIKRTTYRMYSESMDSFFGGTITSGSTTTAIETYLVKEEDVKPLINFWDRVSLHIPDAFLETGTGKVDHIAIAYNRYSDSLLQSGIIERRIASAIMGLEALFLKSGGELQELQYRLSLRVAKLLANFSQDPIQVKKTIKDAYRVRSIFTHGGHLSYNEKKKFELKYKELRNLLLSVLDYLRISLIISMTINIEKEEFIDVIDDSFIDEKNNERLKGLINSAKYILESK